MGVAADRLINHYGFLVLFLSMLLLKSVPSYAVSLTLADVSQGLALLDLNLIF